MTVETSLTTPGRPRRRGGRRPNGCVTAALVCAVVAWLVPAPRGDAKTTATLLPSGDAIELTGEGAGNPFMTTIPVHRSGGVRYFSAGVGLEERQAEYPPFAVKLILVAGPKAYMSRADVTITRTDGSQRVDIPKEHVEGPWLFVDLPAGTYDISAVSQGLTVERRGVEVSGNDTTTVYLRWPRGPELF